MPPDSNRYKCMVAVWMFTVNGTYQVWVHGQGWPVKDQNLGFLGQVSIHFPLFHHTPNMLFVANMLQFGLC